MTAPSPTNENSPHLIISKKAAPTHRRSRLTRALFNTLGAFFLGLGIIGILVPLLPTTPFLLLAATCFMHGSETLHRWLHENRLFGKHLTHYRNREGMAKSAKIVTLILLWTGLTFSAVFVKHHSAWWIWALLLAVGVGVTTHIIKIKTR